MNQLLSRIVLAILLASVCAHAQTKPARPLTATPAHPDGFYAVNEPIRWQLASSDADLTQVSYVIKRHGLTAGEPVTLDLSQSPAIIETSLDEPGSVLVEIRREKGDDKPFLTLGAVVAPDQIAPSTPRPDDFDAFWESKLADLAAIPMNPLLEQADSGSPRVDYFKVTLDNVNNTRIYGQLARPSTPGKFPAIVMFQWAGVYGLNKGMIVPRAEQGFLVFNIMPHDLPLDRDADFYKNAANTTQKNYNSIGNHDREQSYFLRMYLGCHRAVDYLTTRDDWDGNVLIVTGTSMGGQQSFAAAGLHPKVTGMIVNVPAGCDATGPLAGRASGYPYWRGWNPNKLDEVAMNVGRYFDPVNFASRITCPALVSAGEIDVTCPPAGVLAAVNQLKGPKEFILMPQAGHGDTNGSHRPYHTRSQQWFNAVKAGKPLPPVD